MPTRRLRSFLPVTLMGRPVLAAIGAMVLTGGMVTCTVTTLRIETVSPSAAQLVSSPVKAHLRDGSTIMFPNGAFVGDNRVAGTGMRYDIGLTPVNPGSTYIAVPLDSVLAMESFRTETDAARTFNYMLGGTAGWLATLIGACGIAEAIEPKTCFGSCPTVYSDSAGVKLLEAEAFSYSIVPMFEARDIDRLAAGVNERGEVRLEIRNEALETHYINHLELIEVEHAPGEVVVPDESGHPLALGRPIRGHRATDRDGRNATGVLAERDGLVYASSPSRIDAAIASDGEDVEDHIELTVPVSAGTSRIGLHLRMRNSLLATVLFYEMMLGDRGSRALDWLGQDLGDIGPAVELGQWAADNLGMRVSVLDGDTWREVARIADQGPLAWNDVAVVVPVISGATSTARIRLSFPADHWRIDHVTPFAAARSTKTRVIPLSATIALDGTHQPAFLSELAWPDESYLVTSPGQGFEAVFRPGPGRRDIEPDRERTFLIAAQGYYIEWVRQKWLVNGREREPFRPGPESLAEALRRWTAARGTMEDQFYATRIPVR